MRVAVYYTPPEGHPLTRAGALWLGRDAFATERGDAAANGAPGDRDLTREPRRYGFHATMKAPFRLADGRTLDDLAAALGAFCTRRDAPRLGPLRVADLEGFVALLPDGPRPDLEALAADCVRDFDAFRAPATQAEMQRRLSSPLTAAQHDNLRRWGYPYVLADFRFHMTLTGRLADARRAAVIAMLQERFNAFLGAVPVAQSLALFVEAEPGADFFVHSLKTFGDQAELS